MVFTRFVSRPVPAGGTGGQFHQLFLQGLDSTPEFGWIERTHDLEALLNAALVYDPSLESFRAACQRITAFYLVERYPLLTNVELTVDDVRNSLNQVEALIEKLRSETPGEDND